jgi:hypothetical protein
MLFTDTSTNGLYFPSPLRKSGLKLVCNVKIVYRNLMFENSQDYAQKPQQNCLHPGYKLVYGVQEERSRGGHRANPE